MAANRVEVYLHSDSINENKGGCMIRVRAETDFATKTDEFKDFCSVLARMMYAYGAKSWEDLVTKEPMFVNSLCFIEAALHETVTVTDVCLMEP